MYPLITPSQRIASNIHGILADVTVFGNCELVRDADPRSRIWQMPPGI